MQTQARSQKDTEVLKWDVVDVRHLKDVDVEMQCTGVSQIPCLNCCLVLKAMKTWAFPPRVCGHCSVHSTTRHWRWDGAQEAFVHLMLRPASAHPKVLPLQLSAHLLEPVPVVMRLTQLVLPWEHFCVKITPPSRKTSVFTGLERGRCWQETRNMGLHSLGKEWGSVHPEYSIYNRAIAQKGLKMSPKYETVSSKESLNDCFQQRAAGSESWRKVHIYTLTFSMDFVIIISFSTLVLARPGGVLRLPTKLLDFLHLMTNFKQWMQQLAQTHGNWTVVYIIAEVHSMGKKIKLATYKRVSGSCY